MCTETHFIWYTLNNPTIRLSSCLHFPNLSPASGCLKSLFIFPRVPFCRPFKIVNNFSRDLVWNIKQIQCHHQMGLTQRILQCHTGVMLEGHPWFLRLNQAGQ
jgi:hypothetical protein